MENTPKPFALRPKVVAPRLTGFELVLDSTRRLFDDNPVLNESTRANRKMFKAGKTAKTVSIVLFSIIYTWLNVQCFIGKGDVSMPFSYVELILLTIFVPFSIYSSISGEREHATWDALILTQLTAGQIIFGKLIWRLRTVLIIAAFCLVTICVSRMSDTTSDTTNNDVAGSQGMIVTWGMLLCTYGLWVSSVTKRSITSLAVIGLTVIGFLVAAPTLYSMLYSALNPSGSLTSDIFYLTLATFNPFMSLTQMLGNNGFNTTIPWPDGVTGVLQRNVYCLLSAIFVGMTYFRLRVLELPARGRR